MFAFFPVKRVETRMNSFRTVYRKAIYRPSGSGAETLTTSEKRVLKLCDFLKPHLRSKASKSNLPKRKKVNRYKC